MKYWHMYWTDLEMVLYIRLKKLSLFCELPLFSNEHMISWYTRSLYLLQSCSVVYQDGLKSKNCNKTARNIFDWFKMEFPNIIAAFRTFLRLHMLLYFGLSLVFWTWWLIRYDSCNSNQRAFSSVLAISGSISAACCDCCCCCCCRFPFRV